MFQSKTTGMGYVLWPGPSELELYMLWKAKPVFPCCSAVNIIVIQYPAYLHSSLSSIMATATLVSPLA